MKRKQLLALIMAGTLAAGMSPVTMAFAEADTQAMTIDDNTAAVAAETEEGAPAAEPVQDTLDTTQEAPAEEPAQETVDTPAAEPTQAVDTPAAEPTQAVDTPAAEPTQAADETVDDGFSSGETDAMTVAEEEAAHAETAGQIIVEKVDSSGTKTEVTYDTLQAAIDAAPANVDVNDKNTITQIYIKGSIELKDSVVIKDQRNISIASADTESTGATIKRAAEFKGDMFKVTGGSSFQFGLTKDGGTVLNLTVDGSLSDHSEATGSIVNMDSGCFGMSDGVCLTGNITSAIGSAICNSGGSIALAGGKITDNQSSAKKGAIYSTGVIYVSGNVIVSGNTDNGTEETENSIVLDTDTAYITVVGNLADTTDLKVRRIDAAANKPVIALAPDAEGKISTMDEALAHIHYLDSTAYTVNQNGTLEEIKAEPAKLTLKGDSVKWSVTDHQIDVKFHVTSSVTTGQYYATWIKASQSTPPDFETVKKNPGMSGPLSADTITFSLANVDYDTDIKVIIYAEDSNGVRVEKPCQLTLDKKISPVVTETPSREPLTPSVNDSKITGLEKALAFYPRKMYNFQVTGAGTDNKAPIKGDTKWIPYGWSMSAKNIDTGYQKSWSIGNVNGIKQAKTFKMYVFFQKYIYNGTEWEATSVKEYKECEFKSKAIDFSLTPTGSITPTATDGSGGGGGYDYDGSGSGDGSDSSDDPEDHDGTDSDTGSSSATNARTADNSPIATMMMLASLSLIAGGYVIVRKRKKEI